MAQAGAQFLHGVLLATWSAVLATPWVPRVSHLGVANARPVASQGQRCGAPAHAGLAAGPSVPFQFSRVLFGRVSDGIPGRRLHVCSHPHVSPYLVHL